MRQRVCLFPTPANSSDFFLLAVLAAFPAPAQVASTTSRRYTAAEVQSTDGKAQAQTKAQEGRCRERPPWRSGKTSDRAVRARGQGAPEQPPSRPGDARDRSARAAQAHLAIRPPPRPAARLDGQSRADQLRGPRARA